MRGRVTVLLDIFLIKTSLILENPTLESLSPSGSHLITCHAFWKLRLYSFPSSSPQNPCMVLCDLDWAAMASLKLLLQK